MQKILNIQKIKQTLIIKSWLQHQINILLRVMASSMGFGLSLVLGISGIL